MKFSKRKYRPPTGPTLVVKLYFLVALATDPLVEISGHVPADAAASEA